MAFWWNKTYRHFYFKLLRKIGLSSVGKIYLVCVTPEYVKTCLCANNVADLSEINPITVMFWYSLEMKNY